MIETPSNPTNTLVDIKLLRAHRRRDRRSQGFRPVIVCDNTLLGPVFQRPLDHGADVSVYSLTKYVGGHSDLIAGAALGIEGDHRADQGAARRDRHAARPAFLLDAGPFAGDAVDPHGARPTPMPAWSPNSCAIMPRSKRCTTCRSWARARQRARSSRRQCSGAGSTFSFDIKGGETEAFAFLNALQIFKLAVSLGGTESLASHPAAMTHSGVPVDVRDAHRRAGDTIRLSVGIEHPDDLIADLTQALAAIA